MPLWSFVLPISWWCCIFYIAYLFPFTCPPPNCLSCSLANLMVRFFQFLSLALGQIRLLRLIFRANLVLRAVSCRYSCATNEGGLARADENCKRGQQARPTFGEAYQTYWKSKIGMPFTPLNIYFIHVHSFCTNRMPNLAFCVTYCNQHFMVEYVGRNAFFKMINSHRGLVWVL